MVKSSPGRAGLAGIEALAWLVIHKMPFYREGTKLGYSGLEEVVWPCSSGVVFMRIITLLNYHSKIETYTEPKFLGLWGRG